MIKMCCVIVLSAVASHCQEDSGMCPCLPVRRKSVDTPSVLHVSQNACSMCKGVRNLLGHEAGVIVLTCFRKTTVLHGVSSFCIIYSVKTVLN